MLFDRIIGLFIHCVVQAVSYNISAVLMVYVHCLNVMVIIVMMMLICNGNRTEWSSIRSVIIASGDWMSVERKSTLFSEVMITDRFGRHDRSPITNLLENIH